MIEHEHWTYTLPGGYTSPFYSPTFEGAAVSAFRGDKDLQTVHVFSPNGPGVDVTREEAVAMAALYGEEL